MPITYFGTPHGRSTACKVATFMMGAEKISMTRRETTKPCFSHKNCLIFADVDNLIAFLFKKY